MLSSTWEAVRRDIASIKELLFSIPISLISSQCWRRSFRKRKIPRRNMERGHSKSKNEEENIFCYFSSRWGTRNKWIVSKKMGYIVRNVSPPRQWNNEYKFRHILRKCFCPDIICSSRRYVCDDCLSSWRRTWTSIPCGTECHWIFCIIFPHCMKTVLVDRENCIGCTNCTHVCPKIFEMKEGKSLPKRAAEESEIPEVELAIAQCPVQVISWEGGKLKKQSSTGGLFSFFSGILERRNHPQYNFSPSDISRKMLLFSNFQNQKRTLFQDNFIHFNSRILGRYSVIIFSFRWRRGKHFFCIHLTKWRRFSYPSKFRKKEQIEIQRSVRTISSSREFFPKKVFIATGTGIAIHFMMLQRCPKIFRQRFSLEYEMKRIFSRKELSAFPNLKTIITLSAPSERIERTRDGYSSHLFFSKTEFYLCGNPNMIEDGRLYLPKKVSYPKCLLRTLFLKTMKNSFSELLFSGRIPFSPFFRKWHYFFRWFLLLEFSSFPEDFPYSWSDVLEHPHCHSSHSPARRYFLQTSRFFEGFFHFEKNSVFSVDHLEFRILLIFLRFKYPTSSGFLDPLVWNVKDYFSGEWLDFLSAFFSSYFKYFFNAITTKLVETTAFTRVSFSSLRRLYTSPLWQRNVKADRQYEVLLSFAPALFLGIVWILSARKITLLFEKSSWMKFSALGGIFLFLVSFFFLFYTQKAVKHTRKCVSLFVVGIFGTVALFQRIHWSEGLRNTSLWRANWDQLQKHLWEKSLVEKHYTLGME